MEGQMTLEEVRSMSDAPTIILVFLIVILTGIFSLFNKV